MKKKLLILGQIPENFDPKLHIPIAPSCFCGREGVFDDWGNLDFGLDPFSSPQKRIEQDKKVSKWALSLVEQWGNRLNYQLSTDFSILFWKTLLYPYLSSLIAALLDADERVQAALERFKDEAISVQFEPINDSFEFRDSFEFHFSLKGGGLAQFFYQIILKNKEIPPKWSITSALVKEKEKNTRNFSSSKGFGRKNFVRLFNSWFYRCASIKGFTLLDRIIVHFLLVIRRPESRGIAQRKFHKISDQDYNLDCDLHYIIEKTIPFSISKLPDLKKEMKAKFKPGKYRLGSQLLVHDDKFKLRSALAYENGEFLIGVQHGGHNYGSSDAVEFLENTEYECSEFVTWGYNRQGSSGKTFRSDLPSPYLSRFYNKHRQTNQDILIVSTDTSLCLNRIDGSMQPCQGVTYRKMRMDFLGKIKKELLVNCLFRPFLGSAVGRADLVAVKKRFPKIKILNGNLHQKILNCRLLILDHPGTTLNIALAANVPTICVWQNEHFPFTPDAGYFLELMKKQNMYFEDINEAAKFINNLGEDVETWWDRKEIAELRGKWCKNFAFTKKKWRSAWYRYLLFGLPVKNGRN